MDIIYTEEVKGFDDAWMEMYKSQVADVAYKLNIVENSVVECSSTELR